MKILYLDFLFVASVFFYNYRNATWNLVSIIGLVLFLASYGFWILARVQLGKYFSVKAEARGLVTSGLYKKFRNPVYIFSTLATLGAILPSNSKMQYVLLILIIIMQIVRAKKEQALLKKTFGVSYDMYAAKTLI